MDVTAAMVLAAGRGERMRPLSDVVPKPALPLPGGPLVGWSMRLAATTGAPLLIVNVWHLADAMEDTAREATSTLAGVELGVSRESRLLGTAGGLAHARDRRLLGDSGPVLVVNGDVVQALDLRPLLARHADGVDDVTLALLPHLDPRRWSRIELDREGRVDAIRPGGPPMTDEVPLLYPGVMLVSRAALDRIPSGPGETPDLVWEPARAAGRLGGVVVSGHWREVGTPSAYLETAVAMCTDRSRVDADAEVDAEARLERTFVGRGCRVAEGAVVEASVIARGATIGAGASVVRSVVLGPVHIAANETLIDSVRVPG